MSDDEEVVLTSSELHKYIERSKFESLVSINDYEKHVLQLASDSYRDSPVSNSFEIPSLNSSFKKPELCSHTTYLIDTILKTALMYPDHVADIEIYLKIDDIKPEASFSQFYSVLCSSLLLGSATTITLYNKRLKPLHYISIFAGSLYCGYKIYEELNQFRERKKIKLFSFVLERLFSIIKKALSFVFESEFVLKTKIFKEQPIYVPENGWVSSNTAEGLKHSGLLLTEFRAILGEVLFRVIITFDNLTRFMRTYSSLLPHFGCDSDYSELPDCNILLKICVNPTLEDLKKLNNIYLIAQSEFLRRLVLSFVKRFWVKGDYHSFLKELIYKVDNVNYSFLQHISILESFYQKCIKINENKYLQIERNKVLNAKNPNDKLFIFAKNFLTKAEAHILSLSLDLKMINDWINDWCEEKSEENFGAILQDRLVLMKTNIESFSHLYNDNLNILNVINGRHHPSSQDVDNIVKKEEESIKCIQKTGLEVGKSDFGINGEDEVLISLSSRNVTDSNGVLDTDNDYEDSEVQKCLPKNVLMELKFALKSKKEEWIEREKKALKSGDIGKLDFNTLDNTAVEDNVGNVSSNRKKRTYRYNDSESDYSNDESDSLLCLQKDSSCSVSNDSNGLASNSADAKNSSCKKNKVDFSSCDETLNNSLNSIAFKNYHCSFADEIKSAQKSFSLSLKEEKFFDSICDDNDEDEDKSTES